MTLALNMILILDSAQLQGLNDRLQKCYVQHPFRTRCA